ncbi:NusB antitermination factor [Edaphobacter aggregans]|jgi:N utilization substance protein B|uniref:Transcription antitermination protein NusB n=1 Tax=Edaphobacter aggregans TaxID=570835 RepID=A0A428MMI0_9BACT|nr:transcription antitermination factor NusB [Edaphobacter aggregans]RSL18060.1 NusB antitermination factor [Edaphobacter aggregans]
MGTRRKSRELAMQMLFQGDLGKQSPEQVAKLFWPSRDEIDADTRGFAEDIYRIATARQPEIDELIEAHAQNWRIERMAVVDRNLIRAAVAEMLGYPTTPAAIIINESLEIARRYAAPESIHFLNGVLDAIARDILKKRLA